MLQITIWLLCIYLVFKGKEMVMLANLRTPEERDDGRAEARVWFVAAILVAIGFAIWAYVQGDSAPDMLSGSSSSSAFEGDLSNMEMDANLMLDDPMLDDPMIDEGAAK